MSKFEERFIEELEEELTLFDHYKKKETVKTFNTFMRAKYQFIVKMNGITDKKAQIMVSINSLFLGGLMIASQFNNLVASDEKYIILVFLVFTLLSLIFSTLAVRPASLKHISKEEVDKSRLALTITNMGHLQPKDFFEAFDKTMQSQSMIYENVAFDFLFAGKILDSKHIKLRWAYNFFITGLVISSLLLIINFAWEAF